MRIRAMESVFPNDCDVRMMRFVALSLAILAVVLLLSAPGAATAGVSASPAVAAVDSPAVSTASGSTPDASHTATRSVSEPSAASLGTDSPPSPETTFEIRLQSDRSAVWVVTVEYTLETSHERAAFDDLAAEFEAGESEYGPDVSLYENMAALAAERTNREMAIESVQRSSSRTGDAGMLQLSFTWTEFLADDDDRLIFNDALATPAGDSWLTSLEENQTLRITTPRGYAITSANVAFADNTVEIEGPHTFDPDNHVRITLESTLFASTWQLVAGGLLIVLIVGGALYIRRQDDSSRSTDSAVGDAPDGDAADTDSEAVDSAGGGAAEAPAADPEPAQEDLSLLADDERVLRLLERNGGRMRQANIVTETEWSDAKVSQLLSSMADDDRIKKLRIGRENLISLPDVDAFGPKPGEETDRDAGDTADGVSD